MGVGSGVTETCDGSEFENMLPKRLRSPVKSNFKRIAARTIKYLKVRMDSEAQFGDKSISEKLKRIIIEAEEKLNDN